MTDTTGRQKASKIKIVYEALAKQGGFASAQQLYRDLVADGERIGLATIYRNLQSLIELGNVTTARNEQSEVLYSACQDPSHHHHLRCRSCGASVKIDSESAEEWARKVAEEFGYTEVSHTFDVVGICPKCHS